MDPEAHGAPLKLVTSSGDPQHFAADEHSKLVLEAMRHLADQQLERAERVRSAARQTFVYLAGFFTLAQAAAFMGFASKDVTPWEQTRLIWVALVAAIALGTTGVFTLATDKLRKVKDLAPEDVAREGDEAIETDEFVADRLVKLYFDAAKQQQGAVEDRQAPSNLVQFTAAVTVLATLAEVVVSLVVRLR